MANKGQESDITQLQSDNMQIQLSGADNTTEIPSEGGRGARPKHIAVELISLKDHGMKDVPGWLQLFEEVSRINAWNTQVQGINLFNQIAEAGLQDQLGIQFNNAKNVQLLRELLIKTFAPKRSQVQLIAEIKEGQHRRESLKQFANRMSILCEKVYATADSTAMDQFKMEAFIEGIAERKIFNELKREEPTSLEHAIRIAEKWDEIHESRQTYKQEPVMMVMKKQEKQEPAAQSLNEEIIISLINQISINHKEEMEEMRNLILENNRSQSQRQPQYKQNQGWRYENRRGPGREDRRAPYQCWNYGQNGHRRATCPSLPQRQAPEVQRQAIQQSTQPGKRKRLPIDGIRLGGLGKQKRNGYRKQLKQPRRINIIQAHGMVRLRLNNKPIEVLLDSGSSVNVISWKVWNDINQGDQCITTDPEEFNTASTSSLIMDKITSIEVEIGSIKKEITFWITTNNDMPTIIGSQTLTELELVLNMGKGCVEDEQKTWAVFWGTSKKNEMHKAHNGKKVKSIRRIIVNPGESRIIWGRISSKQKPKEMICTLLRNEKFKDNENKHFLVKSDMRQLVPIAICNKSNKLMYINKGEDIAKVEENDQPTIEDVDPPWEIENKNRLVYDKKGEWQPDKYWELQHMEEGNRQQLCEVLRRHRQVFMFEGDSIGRTNLVQHEIHLTDETPIQAPNYRIPEARREIAEDLLKKMKDLDVVGPINSPWRNPLVFVKKKSGGLRCCVDFRRLNKVVKRDAFPLERIEDVIYRIGPGNKYFTTMDLAMGYFQIPLRPEDQEKTAFAGPNELLAFKVLPMGLATASAQCARLGQELKSRMRKNVCQIYMDDVIVCGRDIHDHNEKLDHVLKTLREAGLKLGPDKCKFAQHSITFLGYKLSVNGVEPEESKLDQISKWPRPRNTKEIRSFVGMASYYRSLIHNFAHTARPLTSRMGNSKQFEWTEDCEAAFIKLKEKLTSSPVVAMPDLSKPFLLDVDASANCIGCVLGQLDENNKEHPIAYASKTLSHTEQNYSISKKEYLAIVFGLLKFKNLILGQHVTVRTDHQPLSGAGLNGKENALIHRWREQIADINHVIQYRPGIKNVNADFLSRPPMNKAGIQVIQERIDTPQDANTQKAKDNEENANKSNMTGTTNNGYTGKKNDIPSGEAMQRSMANVEGEDREGSAIYREHLVNQYKDEGNRTIGNQSGEIEPDNRDTNKGQANEQLSTNQGITENEEQNIVMNEVPQEENNMERSKWLRKIQGKSEAISRILRHMEESKDPPHRDVRDSWDEETEQIAKQWGKLERYNGMLWHKNDNDHQRKIVIPKEERKTIFKKAHTEPTAGHFGTNKTIEKINKECYWPNLKKDIKRWVKNCKECRRTLCNDKRNRAPLQPIISGRPNAIVAIDIADMGHTTRFGNRYIIMVIDHFTRWPEAWPSPNQEAETVARLFIANWCSRYGIPGKLISDRGSVFVGHIFKKMCEILGIQKSQTSSYHPQADGKCEKVIGTLKRRLQVMNNKAWDEALPLALLALRTTKHDSTGETPAMMNYGRELRTPYDEQLDLPTKIGENKTSHQFLEQLQDNLDSIHKQAQARQQRKAEKMKRSYDKYASTTPLIINSRAWLEGPKTKMGKTKREPVIITEMINIHTYKISHVDKQKTEKVNRCRLIPYEEEEKEDISSSISEDEDTYPKRKQGPINYSSSEEEDEEENSDNNNALRRHQIVRNANTNENQQQRKRYPTRQNRRPPQRYGYENGTTNFIRVIWNKGKMWWKNQFSNTYNRQTGKEQQPEENDQHTKMHDYSKLSESPGHNEQQYRHVLPSDKHCCREHGESEQWKAFRPDC